MYHIRKIYIFFFVLLSVAKTVHASGPIDDLRKMKEFYKDKKNLYLEFTMTLNFLNFPEGNKVNKCVYMHCEKGTYSKVMEQTKINNQRVFLVVDANEQLAVVSNVVKDGKEIDLNEMVSEITENIQDTVPVDTYYSYSYKGTSVEKIIVVKAKSKETWEFETVEIHLNPDYSMKELVYYYKTEKNNDPQIKQVNIKYSKIDTKNNYEHLCSLESYLKIDKDKVSAKEKLKGYKLIDNRIKN